MSTTALPPDLSRLLAFVRVVEAGSFAEAARRAGTTTSAMSKAVARFEQSRGMRLLHRSTHSLALTEEGDRLMTAGRALAESLARVQSALGEVAPDGGGRVRMTAPASFARACILPRLPAFLRERPEIEIEVKFRNEICDLAAEGVDAAIRLRPARPTRPWPSGAAALHVLLDCLRLARLPEGARRAGDAIRAFRARSCRIRNPDGGREPGRDPLRRPARLRLPLPAEHAA